MEQRTGETQSSELTCSRCGLRRWTKELEAQGKILFRFCDECYWQGEWRYVEANPPEAPPRT